MQHPFLGLPAFFDGILAFFVLGRELHRRYHFPNVVSSTNPCSESLLVLFDRGRFFTRRAVGGVRAHFKLFMRIIKAAAA
ncbi:MAG: hypothetical protein C0483_02350 [Pirellula sp.]|nr:hypothetical protein [Pirellula sp.]